MYQDIYIAYVKTQKNKIYYPLCQIYSPTVFSKLMSEKIHDDTRNVRSSIVLLKGHVPSLTADEGQHVRSNNPLQVALCIQIDIDNDKGYPSMGWDATPHHHTPTAKRTSLSNACILVVLPHPDHLNNLD